MVVVALVVDDDDDDDDVGKNDHNDDDGVAAAVNNNETKSPQSLLLPRHSSRLRPTKKKRTTIRTFCFFVAVGYVLRYQIPLLFEIVSISSSSSSFALPTRSENSTHQETTTKKNRKKYDQQQHVDDDDESPRGKAKASAAAQDRTGSAIDDVDNVPIDFQNVSQLPEWLQAFIYLNNKEDESNADQQRNDDHHNKYIQWTSGNNVGGAGDRLSGIVRLFYVALCTDRRLFVDWTTPSSLANYLQPHFVPWSEKPAVKTTKKKKKKKLLTLLKNETERQLLRQIYETSQALKVSRPKKRSDRVVQSGNPYATSRNVKYDTNEYIVNGGGGKSNVVSINLINRGKSMYLWDPYTLDDDASISTNYRIATNIWYDNEEEKIKHSECMKDYMSRFHRDNDDDDFRNPETGLLEKKWDDINNYYRTAFWTLFQWSPLVVENVRRIKNQLLFSNNNEESLSLSSSKTITATMKKKKKHHEYYVAVHLRTGGSGSGTFSDPKLPGHDRSTWHTYYQCAKSLQRGIREICLDDDVDDTTIPPPAVPIYLASDTSETKKAFRKWDTDDSIRTIRNMEIFHIDKSSKSKLHDADAAELSVWSDIKLLVDSTCIVTSHASRFSRMGVALSSQQPRCAVTIEECSSNDKIKEALSHLKKRKC